MFQYDSQWRMDTNRESNIQVQNQNKSYKSQLFVSVSIFILVQFLYWKSIILLIINSLTSGRNIFGIFHFIMLTLKFDKYDPVNILFGN